MNNCPECPYIATSSLSLCHHWTKTHEYDGTDILYQKINNLSGPHLCECGCKQPTKYLDFGRGYSKFIKGHQSRVKNNWGHNPKVIEKTRIRMSEDRKSGKVKTWNKGLSVDTDKRVKANVEANRQFYKDHPERVEFYSQQMKQQWEDGVLKPMYGQDSSQWKGGISNLHAAARADTNLYQNWKYPILLTANFKCSKCPNTKDLHVHHDKEKFADILNKFVIQYKWSELVATGLHNISKETLLIKNKIIDEITKYHIENKISGIVLCETCHKKEHKGLNF